MASSSFCTPLFFRAEPAADRHQLPGEGRPAQGRLDLLDRRARCSATKSSMISSSTSARVSISAARRRGGPLGHLRRDLHRVDGHAQVVLVVRSGRSSPPGRPRRGTRPPPRWGWSRAPGGRPGARPCSARRRSKSAPSRSILLMNAMRGTPYLSACRQTVSDWGSTPPTPQNTATAPSSTRRLRSTSAVKSTWPGVSMMLIWWPCQVQKVAARRDGDAALALLLHVVHLGGAVIDVAGAVHATGIIQDPLSRRRLTGVDMSHDPDVPDRFECDFARHHQLQVPGAGAGRGTRTSSPDKQRAHDPCKGSTSPVPLVPRIRSGTIQAIAVVRSVRVIERLLAKTRGTLTSGSGRTHGSLQPFGECLRAS